MFTPHSPSPLRPARRGVVLILVLAMLSILALLGVTFATLTGQAKIGASYRERALYNPDPSTIFDFALDQIINDTSNPKSAIRGHSLLRDMYGNDGSANGYFGKMPAPFGWPFYITGTTANSVTVGNIPCTQYVVTTNIPTANNTAMISFCPDLYGAYFGPMPFVDPATGNPVYLSGWTLRLQQWFLNTAYADSSNLCPGTRIFPSVGPGYFTRTVEVVADNATGAFHTLTLSPIPDSELTSGMLPSTPPATVPAALASVYPSAAAVNIFELDGRYQRAFNGTGMTNGGNYLSGSTTTAVPPDRPNFLYNSPINPGVGYSPASAGSYGYYEPNFVSMDEDYDAVDAENQFLALQAADGSVAVPSFYRPNTIVYDPSNSSLPASNDWLNYTPSSGANILLNNAKRSKFFRPRAVDHPAAGQTTFPDLLPNASGQITYDVDNDGDGVTDAVWVDLGYPVQRDASGKAYKPLFAITIIGLNGRLPLNTVGNLQQRDQTTGGIPIDGLGNPSFDHVSHLGYSPFEINPKYALTNGSGGFAGSVLMLKNLLAGKYDSATNIRTPGRYGEAEAIPTSGYAGLPAAGRSHVTGMTNSDYFDSNFNGTDFYPPFIAGGTYPEQSNLLDLAGYPKLPSERMRNFITPLDITGNGQVMEYDQTPVSSNTINGTGVVPNPFYSAADFPYNQNYCYGLGADPWGRHSFFMYFRPPGVNQNTVPMYTDPMTGATSYRPKDSTLNKLHGFEGYRNPAGDPTRVTTNTALGTSIVNREFMARAPFNVGNNDTLPTFNNSVISSNPAVLEYGMYPGGSFALNDDAQLNLYSETPYDEPYDAHDLEWLYRYDPAAQQSLHSRLGTLLGIDHSGGQTYGRLFSVDSWEPIHYAWYQNSFNASVGGYDNTSPLCSAGRKINLNFPLPLSNSPTEPIRQKWCLETYETLKDVLYTARGVSPSPVELAQLGQWVVNIVDFRDPDATMTRFVNPDVQVSPAASKLPAGVMSGSGLVQWGMEYLPVTLNEVLAYQFTAKINAPLPDANNNNKDKTKIQRLFVELSNMLVEDGNGSVDAMGNPVYNGGNASQIDLNGWGLIITADDPNTSATQTQCAVERPNTVTGQLDPNTIKTYFTYIQNKQGYLNHPLKALDTSDNALPDLDSSGNNNLYVLGNVLPTQPAGAATPIEKDAPPYDNDSEELDPALVKQLPLYDYASKKSEYFWIHLVRPANPNLPHAAAGGPPATPNYNELVVVDSLRFPYSESGGAVDTSKNPEVVTKGTAPLYSVGRSQPYRGGHAVPGSEAYYDPTGTPPASLTTTQPFPYGYSEQTSGQFRDKKSNYGVYWTHDTTPMAAMPWVPKPITDDIYHSLGDNNSPRETWDLFPFNDRDFNSVAELLLVPGAPPGLFTKQFAENIGMPMPGSTSFTANILNATAQAYLYNTDPDGNATVPYPYQTPPPSLDPSKSTGASGYQQLLPPANDLAIPHAFPYLPQNFYYSAMDSPTGAAPDVTGSVEPAWYTLLEFFEVPSPVAGAIGPVARGDNGDWLRQEVRPGMINLNLIYDEEVFFGLVDDPRLNWVNSVGTVGGVGALAPLSTPAFITSIDATGNPLTAMGMGNRGFINSAGNSQMKVAFSDFLKLRHGGSGYMGTFVSPYYSITLGNPLYTGSVFPEKPFHSLSAYSSSPTSGGNLTIYDTIMRPARLSAVSGRHDLMPTALITDSNSKTVRVVQTSIAPRMLFQVPDTDQHTQDMSTSKPRFLDSPASETGTIPASAGNGNGSLSFIADHTNLSNGYADLFQSVAPYQLGSSLLAVTDASQKAFDRRQHPYYRTELMQKMMNLATVRTHQFACWITVGLFEVVEEGNTQILLSSTTNPFPAIDQLGKELGAAEGKSVRYKLFCVIDRSRADGYNPAEPEDFNNFVVYSNRIE